MNQKDVSQGGLSGDAVVILVIIAIILAGFAFVNNYSDTGKEVSTETKVVPGSPTDASGGKVGIEIVPTQVEDKGVAK